VLTGLVAIAATIGVATGSALIVDSQHGSDSRQKTGVSHGR
jgi:hypothetical protein